MSIRRLSEVVGIGLATVALSLTMAPDALADDDALAPYRDRFHLGMDRYKAGAIAEAIRIWGAIYEEIGPARGYRLSFNLARAYDSNGEATRAAERYRSFLDEAASRTRKSEALEPIVQREVSDAEGRLETLNREHGRIEIHTRGDATLAQVDDADPRLGAFTAYVAPGHHVVTFGPGASDSEKVEVTVGAGEVVAAQPTRPPPPRVLLPVDPMTRRELVHPFSPVVLYAGGIATAVSVVAPIWAYGHANSVYNAAESQSPTVSSAAKTSATNAYPGTVTVAYLSLALPITLGVATGVLTTWYFAGVKERRVSLGAAPLPGGGVGTVFGEF